MNLKHQIQSRLLACVAAGACLVAAVLPQSAQAGSVTINGGSSGCNWLNYSVDASQNFIFSCGAGSPAYGNIQFSQNTYAYNTNETKNVTVNRVNGTTDAVGATVTVSGGGCTLPSGGAVSFAAGSNTPVNISVTAPGSVGSCTLALGTFTGGAAGGSPAGATITVADPNSPGTVAFSSGSLAVSEGASASTITFARAGAGSAAPAFDVSVTASVAPLGTYTIGGLVAPGATTANGNLCPNTSLVIGCVSFPVGSGQPVTPFTFAAANDNVASGTNISFTLAIVGTTGTTLAAANTVLAIAVSDAAAPPPLGCVVEDVTLGLGQNQNLPVRQHARDGSVAYRMPHGDFTNVSLIAQNASAGGMSMSVSATPCDFGTLGGKNSGCYYTVSAQNIIQKQLRVSTVNGYEICQKPAPTQDGFLYLNIRWGYFNSFNFPTQPLLNNCTFSFCTYQIRRDP